MSCRGLPALVVLAVIGLAAAATAQEAEPAAVPAADQVAGPATEQRALPSDDQVNEIAGDLYCPVCPNTPLDVCETLACSEWREQIREQIAAGMSEDEIADYFVEQYGERVLAKPRRSGFTLLLWVLPLIGISVGIVALGAVLRKWRRGHGSEPMLAPEQIEVSAEARQRIEDELRNLG